MVGLTIFYLAREAKGHGISEVIFSVARERGIIRPVVVLVKAVTTALTIGSGDRRAGKDQSLRLAPVSVPTSVNCFVFQSAK